LNEDTICMRPKSILFEVAVLIALWAAVLTVLHRRHTQVTAAGSTREPRSERRMRAAGICATVGATIFIVRLMTDSVGTPWWQTLSEWASLMAIGAGAVLSGYATCVKG